MPQAIACVGVVTVLISLAPAAFAQSSVIGSSTDLQGLQERSLKKTESSSQPNASLGVISTPSTNPQPSMRLDKNLRLLVNPERDNTQSGVYPNDNNASGNRFQVLYQVEQP